jgi:hypothetical protein
VPIPGAFDQSGLALRAKNTTIRALARVDGHHCTLTSRRRHMYQQFSLLREEIAHAVRAESCVLAARLSAWRPMAAPQHGFGHSDRSVSGFRGAFSISSATQQPRALAALIETLRNLRRRLPATRRRSHALSLEFLQKGIDAGPGGPDHRGQGFLRNVWEDPIRGVLRGVPGEE